LVFIKKNGAMKKHFKIALLLSMMLISMIYCEREESVEAPSVLIDSIFDITHISAKVGSTVTKDGGTKVWDRGVVWSTAENPTLEACHGSADSGGGTGSFTCELQKLSAVTIYYIRAYATNKEGTTYAEQQSFQTSWVRDTQTEVVDVLNPKTGKIWMDRNLGASRAATQSHDEDAYGDLYQWGRAADGHQRRNSAETTITSNTDTPEHGDYISHVNNWRTTPNHNLWQGVNGINNPCPLGYRLPTASELQDELNSWSSQDAAGAFASPLKLPSASLRYTGGDVWLDTDCGTYWTSTVFSIYSRGLYFNKSVATMDIGGHRSGAISVRCIKD
jgi:hypothetical protein